MQIATPHKGQKKTTTFVLFSATTGLVALAICFMWGPATVLACVTAILFVLVATLHPRVAFVAWVVACAFIPFWVGVSSPFYLPPTSIVGLLILASCFYKNKWVVNKLDAWVLVFCTLCLICGVVGISRQGDVTNVATQWLLSFVVGRLLIQRIGLRFAFSVIALTFAAVGAFAVIEFFSDWNPYYSWAIDNAQYTAWGHEQERGGIVRAEWAFGHSIALGCSLAVAIPITAATNFSNRTKLIIYVLLLTGAVVSFSRSGGVAAVLAVGLVIVTYRDNLRNRGRVLLLGMVSLVAFIAVPYISKVFETEGRLATVSSDYRFTLNDLIPTMNPLGLANGYTEPKAGEYYFQGFKSIDSTFILLGVSFGYLLAAIAIIGSALVTIRVLRGTTSASAIALVAVIPALFTVALITQFGSLVWFIIGIYSYELRQRQLAKAPTASTSTKLAPIEARLGPNA